MFKINFLKNILIISCIIATILPLYNIFLAYPAFKELLTSKIEDEAIRVGNHLSTMFIYPGNEPLSDNEIIDKQIAIEKAIRDFQLMKLKIYSKSGKVIYSSDHNEVGTVNKEDYFHQVVSKGKVHTNVLSKGTKSLDSHEVMTDVVETYVPLMKGSQFKGAFEIYYDISEAKQSIDDQFARSSTIQIIVAAGFLLTLLFVLFKAGRSIKEKEIADVQIQSYQNQLQVLISQLTNLEDQERKRISEELHDNIGQYLAISKIKLSKIRDKIPSASEDLDAIRNYIEQTIEYTRSLTFELSSPILYQLGLEQAIEWLTDQIHKKHRLGIKLLSDGKLRNFKGEISIQLYKTVRELLFNIVKHAEAKNATVKMGIKEGVIHIKIEDDGKGFDLSALESYAVDGKHFGLFSIRERISFFQGTINISSAKGKGTSVSINVPTSH